MAAHLGGHHIGGYAEHLGGGDRVDILPAAEGGLHHRISRDMRQQAQLNLGVVRVHQAMSLRGYEHFP